MFRPVNSKPDFVAQEYEILEGWRDRRTFARLRAQNAGGPKWSFLDGPITANNPMGVHHAWGRAYKDLYQRFHAMLGEDQRYQNGFDCQGLWVEVNVERDLGFTSKRDIEAFGIGRLRDPLQAARPDLRRAPDRAVDPARDVDGLERPATSCVGWASCSGTDPAAVTTIQGSNGPVTDTVEMLVGRLGMPEIARQLLHVQQREQRPDLGLPGRVHRRGWLYKGHDTMPWCARCGTGLSQTEMNEGYQDREDPGLTVKLPAASTGPASRSSSGRRRPGR